MADFVRTTPPTLEGAREILSLFKPRMSGAEARLAIKFAHARGVEPQPEWIKASEDDPPLDQLTVCKGDPMLKRRVG